MFFRVRKSKYQKKILLYLLLTAIIPILVLGWYAYYTYVSEFTEKINLSNQSSLTQMMTYVDNLMDAMKRNYIEIVETDEIKWLEENKFTYKNYSQLSKAAEKLRGPTYLSNYVDGYSFIDFKEGWVFTNNGMYPLDDATNKSEIEEIFEKDNNGKNIFWLNNTQKTEKKLRRPRDRYYVNTGYLSLVLKLPLISNDQSSMLIVNIKKDEFERLVNSSVENETIVIFDGNGETLFSNNIEVTSFLSQYSLDGGSIENLKQINIDENNTYNITSLYSLTSRWNYIACYNVDTVSKGADNILYTMALIILSLFLGIIILSIVGARSIYQPVLMLLQHMGIDIKEHELESDEFSYIDNRITSLVSSKSELEALITKQKEQLVELFVLRLIRGNLTKQKIEQNLRVLDIKLNKYFTVISLVPKYNDDNQNIEFAQEDIIRISIIENMPESIKDRLAFCPTTNDKVIILVISHNDESELEKEVEKICKKLYDYIYKNYGGTIKAGISKYFTDLSNFRTAYNESIEAMKNNGEIEEDEGEVDRLGNVTFYSDIAISSNDYLYELVLEKEVKKAVDECDKEKAYEIAEEFIQSLSYQGVVFNEQYFYLYRFLVSIILVSYDAGLPINEIFSHNTNNLFMKFNNLYNYNEILKFYKFDIIDPIIDKLSEFRKSNSEVIFNKIVKLVDEYEGDITLGECADKLDYHPSYIWKIMKNKLDISFSTYTANKKMEYAKKMLLETDMPIADIAKELNYTNAQNFIRFFSKNEGVTPGNYRKMYKHEV